MSRHPTDPSPDDSSPEDLLQNLEHSPERVRQALAELGRRNLYFFTKGILRYRDLTESCHGPVCRFVTDDPSQFKLILMPRDHLKTTVVTISGTLQRIVRDPNERCLIANESATNAERMLRAIRMHVESNNLFRALYPEILPNDTDTWNNQELTFRRSWVGPEPSIDTIGMTGAFTSRHYTYITVDDPISESALKSPAVMKDAIDRFSRFLSLLVNPSRDPIILVGTRWSNDDLYAWAMEHYGSYLKVFKRSAVDESGRPIWPERFTPEILALKRAAYTEPVYACLYMNEPLGNEAVGINMADIGFLEPLPNDQYQLWLPGQRDAGVVNFRDLDVVVTVDLAAAERSTSDRNAVVTTGVTPDGRVLVLDAWGERCSPLRVIEKIIEVHRTYHPRVVGIEGVGYQKVLKWFLNEECRRRGIYIPVTELKPGGKGKPHIKGLAPLIATGRLFIGATQHILRDELAQYPTGRHDDVADALALAQQLWPTYRLDSARYIQEVEEAARLVMRDAYGPIWGYREPEITDVYIGELISAGTRTRQALH